MCRSCLHTTTELSIVIYIFISMRRGGRDGNEGREQREYVREVYIQVILGSLTLSMLKSLQVLRHWNVSLGISDQWNGLEFLCLLQDKKFFIKTTTTTTTYFYGNVLRNIGHPDQPPSIDYSHFNTIEKCLLTACLEFIIITIIFRQASRKTTQINLINKIFRRGKPEAGHTV